MREGSDADKVPPENYSEDLSASRFAVRSVASTGRRAFLGHAHIRETLPRPIVACLRSSGPLHACPSNIPAWALNQPRRVIRFRLADLSARFYRITDLERKRKCSDLFIPRGCETSREVQAGEHPVVLPVKMFLRRFTPQTLRENRAGRKDYFHSISDRIRASSRAVKLASFFRMMRFPEIT